MVYLGWLVGGDFNEIVALSEKSRGNQRPEQQMDGFRLMLDECHLQDLDFEGNKFTWCNGREGSQCISERLDRFVANKNWQTLHPSWLVRHQGVAYSDHMPNILSTEP